MWVARPVKLPDGARVQARNPRITDLRAAYIRQRLLIQRCPKSATSVSRRVLYSGTRRAIEPQEPQCLQLCRASDSFSDHLQTDSVRNG